MKEYTIIIQHGKGKPFSLHTFNNFDLCYCKLLEMINTPKVNMEYYVLNDFFKNEYTPFVDNITKYTIKVRNVSEWETYSQTKHSYNQELNRNNVINLFS